MQYFDNYDVDKTPGESSPAVETKDWVDKSSNKSISWGYLEAINNNDESNNKAILSNNNSWATPPINATTPHCTAPPPPCQLVISSFTTPKTPMDYIAYPATLTANQ